MLLPEPGVRVILASLVVIVPGEMNVMFPPVDVIAMLLPEESDMLSLCKSRVTFPDAARMIFEVCESLSR